MKLRLITELNETDTPLGKLASLSAGEIIDDDLADRQIPFIYLADDPFKQYVYYGPEDGYHFDTVRTAAKGNNELKRLLDDIVRGDSYRGCCGRIAYGLGKVDPAFKRASAVFCYAFDENASKYMKHIITLLLKWNLINKDTLIVYADTITSIAELGTARAPVVTPEMSEKAKLQIALHLGAWPDGKRLTADERKAIRAKLGLATSEVIKRPWQRASEQAGLIQPGQKWWAPTSESRR